MFDKIAYPAVVFPHMRYSVKRLNLVLLVLVFALLMSVLSCGEYITDAEQHFNNGVALYEQGLYNESIAEFNESISLNSHQAIVYSSRGAAYAAIGKYELAFKDYDDAIRLDSQLADTYNNRASAYIDIGEYGLALDDYNEAIRLNPEYAMAYNNRGYLYNILGQKELAIDDHNEAIRLDPQYAGSIATAALLTLNFLSMSLRLMT